MFAHYFMDFVPQNAVAHAMNKHHRRQLVYNRGIQRFLETIQLRFDNIAAA